MPNSQLSNLIPITVLDNSFNWEILSWTDKVKKGVKPLFGKILSKVRVDAGNIDIIEKFTNGNKYLVGSSNTDKCSNYNRYGVEVLAEKENDERYLCWNEKPDGIYVNNVLFVGSKETCFNKSNAKFNNNSVELHSYIDLAYYTFGFDRNILEETLKTSYLYPEDIWVINREANEAGATIFRRELLEEKASSSVIVHHPSGTRVNTLIIRENGEDVLSLTSNELECTGSGTYADRFISRCSIENTEKLNYLKEYVDTIYSNCYKTPGEIKLESERLN